MKMMKTDDLLPELTVKIGNAIYKAHINTQDVYYVACQRVQNDGIIMGEYVFETDDPLKVLEYILIWDKAVRSIEDEPKPITDNVRTITAKEKTAERIRNCKHEKVHYCYQTGGSRCSKCRKIV